MDKIQFIQQNISIQEKQINAVLQLFSEDCTIPFIARYRKDKTGNLGEVEIEQIQKLSKNFDEIQKRKESVLKSIEEQEKLTPELRAKIEQSFDLQEIEDLYLPFKKRRKTKADAAKEKGLEPLAKIIMAQKNGDIEQTAQNYLNKEVSSVEEALQGARDIIAEWINENIFIRKNLRRIFQRKAVISSKVVKTKKEEEEAQKYAQYFDWSEPLNKIPSHRFLAMLRAEKEGFIKVSIDIDKEEILAFMEGSLVKTALSSCAEQIILAAQDAYKRLLEPSISNEILQEAKIKADEKAISIGNGTASRETEFFIKKIAFDRPLQVFVVSEAGASIYSASKIARDEFPDYDITVRGAVSIGRRLSDPLAELVKIDPKSIGVGQYQHDVDQTLLKEELDSTVVKCVNSVGININTASKSLLSYVSGIGEKLAENIVAYRTQNGAFVDRNQIKKVPRLGEKAFQQAAAFIRIKDGKNPLDNSSVHPEAYKIVEKMAKDLGIKTIDLIANEEKIKQIAPEKYTTEDIGILGIKDILKELLKPGLDPRKTSKVFEFDPNIKTFEDLKTGMILPGIVSNITAFGCFVDIGIKENGLVHISQLKDGFVSDPSEVVKLHQQVKVKIIEIDTERKRIALSMVI